MSFGRKGFAGGDIAPPSARPAFRRDGAGHDPASRAAADADPMAGLRNTARPAARRTGSIGDTWNPISDDAYRAARVASRDPAPSSEGFLWGHPIGRNLFVAYLLWFVLGQFSVHRFYCGQSASAWQQIGLLAGSVLVTLVFPLIGIVGLLGWSLWLLADLFLIPGMLSRYKDEYAEGYRAFL